VNIIEIKDVIKNYALGNTTVKALRGINLTIEEGDLMTIMGPSGSGKSTLLHLLGGLDQPSDGEVILGGQKLSILNDNQITLARRHNVGFVFQFFNLLPTLSAAENIALPIIIDGKNPRDYDDKLTDLLNLVGLAERRDHKPDQLSGGEQQRVAMARALLTEPAIVLADEPTGNLDSKTGNAIMELLRRSCDELNQATIVVTHDARAAAFADRVVFLQDGNIINEMMLDQESDIADRRHIIMKMMESLEI
jgi:putative ABC transport system ATP-binding protein